MIGLVLLLIALLESVAPQDGFYYREHTLEHPFSASLTSWEYSGDAIVTEDFVRLTPDRQSRKGAIWNLHPWKPNSKQATFEVTIAFKVHGQGKKLFGDGFAFWYTQGIGRIGNVFGNEESFVGFGILFDTYSNHQQQKGQYISVIFNDGTKHYDHAEDGGSLKVAGCHIDFRGAPGFAKVVLQDALLRLYVSVDGVWSECFILRQVHVPVGYHFGLSAATGDLADNHDIISFHATDPAPMTAEEQRDIEERINQDLKDGFVPEDGVDPQYVSEAHGSSGTGFYIFVVIVIVGGIIAFLVIKRKQPGHALPY